MSPNARAWIIFTLLTLFAVAALVFALVVNQGSVLN